MIEFEVRAENVLDVPSDLLLLKYAQGSYGADRAVATRLTSAKLCTEAQIRPAPGDSVVVETNGAIAPQRVLFVGTPALDDFTYDEMERFACRAIGKIVDSESPVRSVRTTVHGTGYGLDGGEALQRLVRGFRQGHLQHRLAPIERITFLTLEERSERMLNAALAAVRETDPLPTDAAVPDRQGQSGRPPEGTVASTSTGGVVVEPPAPADARTVAKRRVFVALPFSEEFQNVYDFGIYPAVRNCGYICERVDEAHFTGHVLSRIREGIERANLVIADLTEGRPNVYLEVGYAWGKGVPVIFVARKGEQLHFDVSTHRCIFYGRFTQFAEDLGDLIRGIDAGAQR